MRRTSRTSGSGVLGVAAALAMLVPSPAGARCTTTADLRALRGSLLARIACSARRVVEGPGAACAQIALPTCSGTAADDIADIITGQLGSTAPDPQALSRQIRCQVAVARAAARFARLRIPELAQGRRGQGASANAFRLVKRSCAVGIATDQGGVRLPRLGGACASLTNGFGAADGAAIARCVRPAIERVLQQAVSGPLPPNVVVIMTDDQRWDQMAPLPTVRRELGRFGVTFTESIAPTSLCCPSRSSFFTGRLALHHGVRGNALPIGGATVFDPSQTIAVWLANAGYATALYGKYMNAYNYLSPAIPPGWTEWQAFVQNNPLFYNYTLNENGTHVEYGNAPGDYSTDLLGGRVVDFIQLNAATPFFVDFTPFAPHEPAIPAPRHAGAYANTTPARPPNYREPDLSLKPTWVRFQAAVQPPNVPALTDTLRINMLESLIAVDEAAAAILNRIEDLGLTDNTLVIFTSDNGLHLLEHWWSFKNDPYEESIRVPLYLRYPLRRPAPATQHQLVATIDLAPTILDAAGITTPAPIDGRSLFDAIDGVPNWRTDILLQHWGDIALAPSQAVRSTRWKYIHTDGGGAVDMELYDLLADPWELHNLAYDPAYAATLASQQTRLDELLAQ